MRSWSGRTPEYYQEIDNNGTGTLTVPSTISITTNSALGLLADYGGSFDFQGAIVATPGYYESYMEIYANAWVNNGTIALSGTVSYL